jgi:hypothetical protein
MQFSRRAAASSILATLLQAASAQGVTVQYTLNLRANFGGTAHALDYEAKPASLKRRFGMPLLNDGDSESMGTYIFVGPAGEVLTLYFRANDVPRARIEALQQKFWNDEDDYSFSIGAKSASHAQPFVKWLRSEVGAR